MKIKLSPSIICAGVAHLKNDVRILEKFKVDYLHVDVMDGHFVTNLFGGPEYIESLRTFTKTKLDIHLLVEEVERMLDIFNFVPGDRVSFHYESTAHVQRVVSYLRDQHVQVGISLCPATPLSVLECILPDIDFVQILTINPGHSGGKIVPYTFEKIAQLKKAINDRGLNVEIVMDGASDFSNIVDVANAGADTIVIGKLNCFAKDNTIEENMKRIIQVLTNAGYW